MRDRDRDRASFSVAEEGARPCLVIEVASPRYSEIDYGDKVAEYRRAGVAEYLIVDFTSDELKLTGFRLEPGSNRPKLRTAPPDRGDTPTAGGGREIRRRGKLP